MIKYTEPSKIIKTEQFIREPVDLLSREILNHSSKKIILNGNGTGKSVILHHIQDKGLGTDKQTILTKFDSSIISFHVLNKLEDKKFVIHYYELLFSLELLSYVKSNYCFTYENYFQTFVKNLKKIVEETESAIRQRKLPERLLSHGEYSRWILCAMENLLDVHKFNLAIDNFDQINSSSYESQQILSKYFPYFDKVIITSNDQELEKNDVFYTEGTKRKQELEKKGYAFITPHYGRIPDILIHIIKKRIKLDNTITTSTKQIMEEDNDLANNIYKKINICSDGNISLALKMANEVIELLNSSTIYSNYYADSLFHHSEDNNGDLEYVTSSLVNDCDNILDETKSNYEKTMKMGHKHKPKLKL